MRCLHGLGFAWVSNGSYYNDSRVCRLCGLVQEYETIDGVLESRDEWVSVGYAEDTPALAKKWWEEHKAAKQHRRTKKRAEREAEEKRLRNNIIRADHDHAQEPER